LSLEDKVNDKGSGGFIKKAAKMGFHLALAGATTALSMSTVGAIGPLVGLGLAGGAALGSLYQKKPVYETALEAVKTYSALNAVIWPLLSAWDATIPLIPNDTIVGKLTRGLYASTIFNAGFVTLYDGAKHLVDNYFNPKGITKSVKDNFYNKWKRPAVGFFPAYFLAANGVPALPINVPGFNVQLPTFAANAFGLSAYNSLNPISGPKDYPTYKPVKNYTPALAH
jgi:hypothetical protein